MGNLRDKLMHYLMEKTVLYNWSWEDPCIDQKVLSISAKDKIATIASAGDNCFHFLSEPGECAPARIDACDINTRQIFLVDLKRACIIGLEHEEFWRIFAEDDVKYFRQIYENRIRPYLKEAGSVKYWDKTRKTIKSFMFFGASGFLAKIIFHNVLYLFFRTPENPRFSTDCRTYKVLSWVVFKMITGFLLIGRIFQGVPLQQFVLYRGSFAKYAQNTHRDVLNHKVPNYFYSGYTLGKYTETCCPQYMLPGPFLHLKNNIHSLHLYVDSLQNMLAKLNEKPTIVLPLDSLDWMTDEGIQESVHQFYKFAPQAQIFWRSFDKSVHSPALFAFKPKKVDDTQDRVKAYKSTWIGQISTENPHFFAKQSAEPLKTRKNKMLVWKEMLCHSFIPKNDSFLRSYYKNQATKYDDTRKSTLHGRDWMINAALSVCKKEKDRIWIDVGAGTGGLLDFVNNASIKTTFQKVYLIDDSPDLLQVAEQKIKARNINAELINQKIENISLEKWASLLKSASLITFSYSVSMFSPMHWDAILKNIQKFAPSDCTIGYVDFSALGHARLPSLFWTLWFRNNGVYLNKERAALLKEMGTVIYEDTHQEDATKLFCSMHEMWCAFILSKSDHR